MPSLVHAFYAYVVPRVRGAGGSEDPTVVRAGIEALHATPEFFFRPLPTGLVLGGIFLLSARKV